MQRLLVVLLVAICAYSREASCAEPCYLREGGLQGYKVLYLCGRNLQGTSAEEIRQWAGDGGTLYTDCASGLFGPISRARMAGTSIGRGVYPPQPFRPCLAGRQYDRVDPLAV
jgi:hypothetical protein